MADAPRGGPRTGASAGLARNRGAGSLCGRLDPRRRPGTGLLARTELHQRARPQRRCAPLDLRRLGDDLGPRLHRAGCRGPARAAPATLGLDRGLAVRAGRHLRHRRRAAAPRLRLAREPRVQCAAGGGLALMAPLRARVGQHRHRNRPRSDAFCPCSRCLAGTPGATRAARWHRRRDRPHRIDSRLRRARRLSRARTAAVAAPRACMGDPVRGRADRRDENRAVRLAWPLACPGAELRQAA